MDDPLEGSSHTQEVCDKTVMEEDSEDEADNAIRFLEITIEKLNQEIVFNSTEAMPSSKTGKIVCMYCLLHLEENQLSEHMRMIHNYRKINFKCYNCKMIFTERLSLNSHKNECNPQKRHRKTFLTIMRNVDCMIQGIDDYEEVSCPTCSLKLPKYCLKNHMISEHDTSGMALTCRMCNRNFKTKLTLTEHIKLVHDAIEDSEECDLCGQKYSSVKYLMNHKRNVHPTGDKVFKCEYCGKEFKSHLNLHQHKKYVHPPKEASVQCPHCPHKTFKSKINLRQHYNITHGDKRRKKKAV